MALSVGRRSGTHVLRRGSSLSGCGSRRPLRCAGRRDGGSMAVEVVILVPLLFAFVLLIAAGGRLVLRQGDVDSAARDAARAASLARSSGEAQGAAASAVSASMGATSCPAAVDTSDFVAGGSVTVQISCVITYGDLGLVGLPGSTTVRGTSVAPLDQFRRTGTP